MRTFLLRAAAALASFVALAGCLSDVPATGVPYQLRGLVNRPLDGTEQGILDSKGFVLSNIQPTSFHEGYAALYKGHQPVYFTADAVLHALHCSFDAILSEIETEVLARELDSLLSGLRDGLAKNGTAPAGARAGLDAYLAVAKSLLDGKEAAPVAGGDAAVIGALVRGAEEASGPADIGLFGPARPYDLSMMKPRGHYTQSRELMRYFRAMMWLGTIDIRLAEKEQGEWKVNRTAVRAAALAFELSTPAVVSSWQKIDRTTEAFVGPPDSMSLPGLSRSMKALDFPAAPLDSKSDNELLAAFAPEANQKILGSLVESVEHPLAFLLLGQRFVFDSYVFRQTTYAAIPAHRLMPSPLDVAAAVFANPAAEPLLAGELETYRYRDSLHDVAREGQKMGPALWRGSLYHGWLGALSKLSPAAARDRPLPAVFRGEAWQRRMLSSQLASWAELRHDTVLYAKQSFTTMLGCDYPDGYVDPYPEFWAEIEHLGQTTRGLVNGLDFGKNKHLGGRIVKYFELVSSVAHRLGQMASLERANAPLGDEDVEYLKGAVAIREVNQVCTTTLEPEGWHADLYFDRSDIMKDEPIVSDVHTQPTDEGGNMVGRVLHAGTGHPRQITIAIQTDTGVRTYRGVVSTYHELITGGFNRLNDEEWRKKLATEPPEDPPWLKDLVAGRATSPQ